MTIALTIVQVLLGLLFVITGSFKFFQNRAKIIESGGAWAEDFPAGIIKLIAFAELICGLSLLVSRFLWYNVHLTIFASCCITAIMAGSIVVHIRRKEWKHAAINTLFLLMAGFVFAVFLGGYV